MKTIIRHLIIVFILLLGSAATLTLQAKTVYPIQLTAQLLPPYSNCLGDYMSGSMDRVSVMAVMKDVSFEAGNQPKSYKIQLRMVVRQGNRVVLESKTKLGNAMTFDLLRDGLVKRLEGAGRLLDPAYSIINAPGYSSNGYCVNEGSYDIVFQAFDARNPQMALSEPYSFHVYLNESEPVSLMSPIHNTCVGMNTGAITFMWMERTVPLIAQNKKYHFEIREVQEGAVSMENAAETGNIVHSEELNSSVTMRVVPVTAGKFKVGRTYVWRIQIVGQDTKVKNNGWSEVGVFRYDRCMDKIDVVKVEGVCNDLKKPEIVKAETLKEPQGTISWVLNDDAAKVQEIDSFRVEYTLASDQVGFWTRVPVSRSSAQAGTVDDKTFEDELSAKYKGKTYYTHQLANLDKGKEYVVRISSIKCSTDKDGNVVADCHSVADSVKFTLPLMEAGQAGQCRMEVPELTCKEDVDPNHKPNKGDYIYANGANVKILDIAPSKTEGGHTYYSGTGITSLPFLEGVVGLYMRFDDIRISCDNELLEGKIVTVYDENNSFSLDLNGLLNDNYMGTGPTPQQESIQPVRSKEQVEDGTVGIVTDGEDEGAVYAKSPEGGSAPVKVGEKFSCDEVAESDIDDEYGTFTFTPLEGDNTPYDLNAGKFDKPTIMKYYEKFGTYDVPWFAVVQGKTSTIKATFKPNAEGKEVDLDRISFICKTKKDAIKLEAKKTGDYTYTLTIFGDVPDQSLCIYAVYMEKDGKAVSQDLENDDAAQDDACKTLVTLGKAKIASMKYRKKKLIMIPVGNNITINTDNIQQTLDAVYAPLGVKYTVTQEPAFVDEQVNSILSEGLDVTDHSIFKDESQNMRLLQQLYKGTHEESIDVDATYLFVLPKVAGMESVKGIMPLNRSVGYVFVGENGGEYADGVTVAHELGHGMFSFQHSFDYGPKEGETDNLMDYSNPEGTHLAVWQWNLISTHKTYTIPFLTTDEDGMYNEKYLFLLFDEEDSKITFIKYIESVVSTFNNNFGEKQELEGLNKKFISFFEDCSNIGSSVSKKKTYKEFCCLINEIYKKDTQRAYYYNLIGSILFSVNHSTGGPFQFSIHGNKKFEAVFDEQRIYFTGMDETIKLYTIEADKIDAIKDVYKGNFKTLIQGEKETELKPSLSDLLHECIHVIYPRNYEEFINSKKRKEEWKEGKLYDKKIYMNNLFIDDIYTLVTPKISECKKSWYYKYKKVLLDIFHTIAVEDNYEIKLKDNISIESLKPYKKKLSDEFDFFKKLYAFADANDFNYNLIINVENYIHKNVKEILSILGQINDGKDKNGKDKNEKLKRELLKHLISPKLFKQIDDDINKKDNDIFKDVISDLNLLLYNMQNIENNENAVRVQNYFRINFEKSDLVRTSTNHSWYKINGLVYFGILADNHQDIINRYITIDERRKPRLKTIIDNNIMTLPNDLQKRLTFKPIINQEGKMIIEAECNNLSK
ncbi:MAG: hypothetical protein J5875_02705 [Paludibacteraceae bacterium]|nr:hypothetical protein [Paludibacteraceae bacterium]